MVKLGPVPYFSRCLEWEMLGIGENIGFQIIKILDQNWFKEGIISKLHAAGPVLQTMSKVNK